MLATNSVSELTFIITKECNLNCEYCSQRHIKDIPDKKYINQLTDNFNKIKLFLNDFVYIDLFGGEPLLYQNELKYLINFLRDQENKLNKTFKIRVFTNGILQIKDLEYFEKNKIVFSISFDGLGDKRGKNKGYIIENIKVLNKLNLIDKISFSILNPLNNYLLKNYYYISSIIGNLSKVTHYLIREPYLWTEEGVNNYLKNFDKFIEFSKIYKKDFNEFPLYIKAKLSFFNKNKLGCESGINRFTISNNILDCGVINFENEFFAKNKNYLKIYEKYCSNCEIQKDCDKKCPKYFLDYPEIFNKTFCKIKKYEINKIKELL